MINSRYRSVYAICGTKKRLTLEELSDKTGLSKSALGSYESNDTKDISHYAIMQLAKFYGVTTDYLLGLSEQKTAWDTSCQSPDNAEICAYISDKKLNKRLLRELISHEGFPRLLADIEIYIDNIAGMHDSSRQSFAPYGILMHGLTLFGRS